MNDFANIDLVQEDVECKSKQARLVLKELSDGSFDVRVAPREPRVVDLGVLMKSFEAKIRAQREKSRLENKNFAIGVVNFTGCGLDDRCVAIIMSVLAGYGLSVHTLKLSKNCISDAGFQCICEYLSNSPRPATTLYVSRNNITRNGAYILIFEFSIQIFRCKSFCFEFQYGAHFFEMFCKSVRKQDRVFQ